MPVEPSGHVFRVERKRGPQWYAKYRPNRGGRALDVREALPHRPVMGRTHGSAHVGLSERARVVSGRGGARGG
jgi:hypothetical protein